MDKKEKSSNSVISPESWFKHFTELFLEKTSEHHFIPLKKTSEHHFIPEYTYLPIYLYQLKHSNLYSVHRVITIQNHPGPN